MYKLEISDVIGEMHLLFGIDLPSLEGKTKGYAVSAMLKYLEEKNTKAFLADIEDPASDERYLRSAIFKDDHGNIFTFNECEFS